MDRLMASSKQILITVFLLLLLPLSSYAAAGCCSGHQGVASCNAVGSTCKDGSKTTSNSCKCNKPSKRGCCSNHGGLAKGKTSGPQKCQDGTDAGPNCS